MSRAGIARSRAARLARERESRRVTVPVSFELDDVRDERSRRIAVGAAEVMAYRIARDGDELSNGAIVVALADGEHGATVADAFRESGLGDDLLCQDTGEVWGRVAYTPSPDGVAQLLMDRNKPWSCDDERLAAYLHQSLRPDQGRVVVLTSERVVAFLASFSAPKSAGSVQ